MGKLIPFWLIALFELGFGLFLGRILFHIPIEGSLLLLYGFAAVYLIAILGLDCLYLLFHKPSSKPCSLIFSFDHVCSYERNIHPS